MKRPKLLNRDAKELPMVDPSVSLPDAEGKIGGDCMLGAGTKVGERCTFKRSIIGEGVVIIIIIIDWVIPGALSKLAPAHAGSPICVL